MNPIRLAEFPHFTIPAPHGVTSILNEVGQDLGHLTKGFKLFERDITDPEQASPATFLNRFYRSPGIPIGRRQPLAYAGTVQDQGIDDIRPEVPERTGERLLDLRRDRSVGVVRKPVVLPRAERELGLQEEFIARDNAFFHGSGDGPTDRRLVVMASLVGGVDSSKPLPEGQAGQSLGFVLFPRGSVEEARDANAIDRKRDVVHIDLAFWVFSPLSALAIIVRG